MINFILFKIFPRILYSFLIFLAKAQIAENINLECQYFLDFNNQNQPYQCNIDTISFAIDDESQNFTITGNHLPGRTNDDVTYVRIFRSNVPFIITKVFETFPNLARFMVRGGGLRRIQSNAIGRAEHLTFFDVHSNPQLTKIHANAFIGASNLRMLLVHSCAITDIDENAFVGLNQVNSLTLSDNQMRDLPVNVFRPLLRLDFLNFARNRIQTLNTTIFSHNNRVHQLDLRGNQINAIEGNFFDNIPGISLLNLQSNVCINRNFLLFMTNLDAVKIALEPCFNNFELK